MVSYVELHHHKARQRWYSLMNVLSICIHTSVTNAATSPHFTRRLCTEEQLVFLNSSTIPAQEQFIFRQGLSVDKVLHNFIDEILYVLNNKIPIRLQCVHAKASDCENYDILVPQLNFYGLKSKF